MATIIASGQFGQYTPKVCADRIDGKEWHLPPQILIALKKGPNDPNYWRAWNLALHEAYKQDRRGNYYELAQLDDGSVAAVRGK